MAEYASLFHPTDCSLAYNSRYAFLSALLVHSVKIANGLFALRRAFVSQAALLLKALRAVADRSLTVSLAGTEVLRVRRFMPVRSLSTPCLTRAKSSPILRPHLTFVTVPVTHQRIKPRPQG